MKIIFSEDGIVFFVIFLVKVYDDGIYKCIVRNKIGKFLIYVRVMVGGKDILFVFCLFIKVSER